MIQGIRPVVKSSIDLVMESVKKAADDLIWQQEYEKARESYAVHGELLADTTYKDVNRGAMSNRCKATTYKQTV